MAQDSLLATELAWLSNQSTVAPELIDNSLSKLPRRTQRLAKEERKKSYVKAFPAQTGLCSRQDHLAGVLALFHIGLRLADLREREAFVHMRPDPAIRDALQQYFHPTRDHLGLVPHVAKVHAEG